FVVVDVRSIHKVGVDFCKKGLGCTEQLLQMQWFPAMSDKPKTAATFQVLEAFQLLSFGLKVSGYVCYKSLARRTDNTG
ncbi:hypothetical protein SERLA73DRAFT_17912, partial [Serpula lacrymans var. lacrymans S7.3]